MVVLSGWRELRGRRSESEALDRLVEAVRAGESRALVVRGEPGVGKTMLLDYVVERASGCRVARAAGVQSEMELAFAGLHQLCAPLLDRIGCLPSHQRDALRIALGLSAGPAPDRFLVGLAVLGLLAEVAREQPLICLVDDVQWLDRASAQAMAFVARRLCAESVAMIFGARESDDVQELVGLAVLAVGGLPGEDARALLASALPWPVDERVRDRIVAEARGNPLALLELPRGLTPAQLAGGFGPVCTATLPARIEDSFRRRFKALGMPTRQLLLIAAAEPLGDPKLVWRAAELLGIAVEAAGPAAAADLLEIGARVRFRHPLQRSAIYKAASPEERRRAHRVLAEATDPEADPDRRAWHAAQAASWPNEDIAADLERSACRAQARGGLAAAAAFLERAAELTREPALRAERALVAAQAKHRAGMPAAAQGLLFLAESGSLTALQRARVDLLRAQVAFTVRRGSDAPPLLLKAAKQFEALDTQRARETYLEALSAAMFAGLLGDGVTVREVAEAARAAPVAGTPPTAADLLLDGLAVRFTDGYAAGMPLVRQALEAFRSEDIRTDEALRWLWPASRAALLLWDFDSLDAVSARFVALARDTGALAVLPIALSTRVHVHSLKGEMGAAALLVQELETVTEVTANPFVPYGALLLAAWRGREAEVDRLIDLTTAEVLRRGEGVALVVTGWARALLYNSLGRYTDALAAAGRAAERQPQEVGISTWATQIELIEAAVRSGKGAVAAGALERLTEATGANGTEWGLGITARSRGLLTDGPAAEDDYREAIDRLSHAGIRGELARAHLVYGEWLRRQRQRVAGRRHLRTAHEMFTDMGMEAFAQRASRELRASGATAPKPASGTPNLLTAQETQIARLVREGLSNPEIAARLFISPHTVEWHLRKIFKKLRITSRKQLDLADTFTRLPRSRGHGG